MWTVHASGMRHHALAAWAAGWHGVSCSTSCARCILLFSRANLAVQGWGWTVWGYQNALRGMRGLACLVHYIWRCCPRSRSAPLKKKGQGIFKRVHMTIVMRSNTVEITGLYQYRTVLQYHRRKSPAMSWQGPW